MPTGKIGRRLVVEEAVAKPLEQPDVVRAAVGDQQVGHAVAQNFATAVETGPTPAWIIGPCSNVKPFPSGTLSKIETSLDPLLAMIRSSRPLPVRSATVMPTGSVPV